MAQDLVRAGTQDVEIPEEFKNAPVPAAFAHLNPEEESLTEGIGSSYAVISYRGKNWTFRYKGSTYTILNPLGEPSSYIDVVILRKAKNKSKSYYPKGEGGFNPDDIDAHKRPTCSSLDGVVPDEGVKVKQSDTCALCEHNQWKPQPNGKPGRACQDRMRLAVFIMPSMITPLLGAPLLEPMFLPIPPASMLGLSQLGDVMEKSGKHFSTYITRIQFKPEKSWPEFKYKVAGVLTDKDAPAVISLRDDPQAARIIGDRREQPGTIEIFPPQAPVVELFPTQPAASAVEARQAAERAARIAAVRSGAPPPSEVPKLIHEAPVVSVDPAGQIAALQAQLAALQNPTAPLPALHPTEVALPATAAPPLGTEPVESSPDMDDLIASMMPQKPL
jgi:hypothetical protein